MRSGCPPIDSAGPSDPRGDRRNVPQVLARPQAREDAPIGMGDSNERQRQLQASAEGYGSTRIAEKGKDMGARKYKPGETSGLYYSRISHSRSNSIEDFTPSESPRSTREGANNLYVEEEGWTTVTRRRHVNRESPIIHAAPPAKRNTTPSHYHTYLHQERLHTREPSPSNYPSCTRRPATPPVPAVPRFTPGSTPKSWKDICTSVRNTSEECVLEYIEPLKDDNGKCYAQVTEEEI